jgi:putative Mn2+ efflux pump MntP
VLTTIGMLIGKAVGARFGKTAELLGGVALIGIGALILAEHMGWIGG